MEIIFVKPSIEPMFEAVVYRSKSPQDREVYRVMIGREGTEVNYQGDVLEIVDFSGLTTRQTAETWVEQQVVGLKSEGKRVEFDENLSYVMARAVDELAA